MDFIGLFFGSFNPIHNGHLAIARYLLDEGYCGKIWFVVSPQNPWKKDQTLLDEQRRLEIVDAAIAGDERMSACDIEFSISKPSYTYRTLKILSQKYPGKRFVLIIGGDNLERFHLWKNYEEILAHYPVFVYPRPGGQPPRLISSGVKLVDAPLMNIASSEIRNEIAEGKDISGKIPAEALSLVKRYYGKTGGGEV